jgi:hypothetical protein
MQASLILRRPLWFVLAAAGLFAACSASDPERSPGSSNGGSSAGGTGQTSVGGAVVNPGVGGDRSGAPVAGSGGGSSAATGGGAGDNGAGALGDASAGANGVSGGGAGPAVGGGAGGAGGLGVADAGRADASRSDAASRADASAVVVPGSSDAALPPNCTLPTTVSFQRDVQPFLIASCGGGNCHVLDTSSTVSAGGFNHGYDWLTAGSHASSCPSTPTPTRFDVVIAVINAANPPSCSRSRKMPPPNATGADLRAPLTACQVATLQAWLNEPRVTQTHRADDSSPTTPYAMPPFN